MTAKKIAYEERMPVYTYGEYFLAMTGLVKRLERESTFIAKKISKLDELKSIISSKDFGIVVCHCPSGGDLREILRLIEEKGASISSLRRKILLITHRLPPQDYKRLRDFNFVKVLETTVESFELFDHVVTSASHFREEHRWAPAEKAPKKEPVAAPIAKSEVRSDQNRKDTKTFLPVTNQKRGIALLNEGKKFKNKIAIWIPNLSEKLDALISVVDEANGTFDIMPYHSSSNLAADIKRWSGGGTQELYFNLNLRRSRIFFASHLISADRIIQFSYPKFFYEVQRRQQLRLPLFPQHKIIVSIGLADAAVKNYMMDNISAGGFAFLCDKKEAAKFEIGKKVVSVNFLIGENSFTINQAEVRHISSVEGSDQMRVGIFLKSISKDQAAAIDFFVVQQSMQDLLEE